MVMQLILKKVIYNSLKSLSCTLARWVGLFPTYKYFSVLDSDRIVYNINLLNWSFI